ncbi:hypothetical protein [Horticoccus sp. 23ND18S-11]|uniref:hypothetical protein n=1 Tax=Horticoccus sp. 23ND18S-11 TaxID=3391832 RepID=UPI0039C92DC1
MSAAEIVEMIERLPPIERAEVFALLEKKKAENARREIRHLPAAEAQRIAEQVFKDHSDLFRKLAQ